MRPAAPALGLPATTNLTLVRSQPGRLMRLRWISAISGSSRNRRATQPIPTALNHIIRGITDRLVAVPQLEMWQSLRDALNKT